MNDLKQFAKETEEGLVKSLGVSVDEAQHLTQWVLRALPHIEAGMPFVEALDKGRKEYEDFLVEMTVGTSPRARLARKAIATVVYSKLKRKEAEERLRRDEDHGIKELMSEGHVIMNGSPPGEY